jgi:predicted outer membrane repeat protein
LSGGGITISRGRVTTSQCLLQNNSAINGGALASAESIVIGNNNIYSDNSATSAGGVLSINGGIQWTETNGRFIHNSAAKGGAFNVNAGAGSVNWVGGIVSSSLNISDSTFNSNTASVMGEPNVVISK